MSYLKLSEQEHIESLFNHLKNESGFTIDNHLNHYTGTGYAVALPGTEIKIPRRFLTLELFTTIVLGLADRLAKNENVGAWHRAGYYYFDISVVKHDREEAKRLGEQYKQEAIFDFVTKDVIFLF